ncbi:MAG: hypothetical protein HF967_03425 [Methanosarcinales archaeon]|nr:hypothetical protein [Methanosarcinales archaeon]
MCEIIQILNDIFYIDEKIESIINRKRKELDDLEALRIELNAVYKKIKQLK